MGTTEVRDRDQVDGALKLVETLRANSAMGDDAYYKCLVSLAYEYLLADEHQLALVLLAKPPVDYYERVQLRQMEEDGMYRDLVVLLAYRLVQMGLVTSSEDTLSPTMAPAKA
jgi:hypothetical protein